MEVEGDYIKHGVEGGREGRMEVFMGGEGYSLNPPGLWGVNPPGLWGIDPPTLGDWGRGSECF